MLSIFSTYVNSLILNLARGILYFKLTVCFSREDWLVYMEPNSVDYGRLWRGNPGCSGIDKTRYDSLWFTVIPYDLLQTTTIYCDSLCFKMTCVDLSDWYSFLWCYQVLLSALWYNISVLLFCIFLVWSSRDLLLFNAICFLFLQRRMGINLLCQKYPF